MLNKYYNQSFRLKTEKAIESVNNYEALSEDFRLKIRSLHDQISKKQQFRIISEGAWNKVQLVTASAQLYQLAIDDRKAKERPQDSQLILKIVIKNFTGKVVHLSLSPKPEIVKLGLCEYKISDQKMIKVREPILQNNRTYLTLHSPADLIVFKMKYEFVVEEEEKVKEKLKSSSVKLLKINNSRYGSQEKFQVSEEIEAFIKLKKGKIASPRSIVLDKSRSESARADHFLNERQKLELAREKRKDIEVYRQKGKALRILSQQCTSILKEYKIYLEEEDAKKRILLKNLVVLVTATNFIANIDKSTTERQQGIQKAKTNKAILKKCSNKFLTLTKQLKALEKSQSRRELLAVFYHSACAAKTFLKEDCRKAKEIVRCCFDQSFICMALNQAFERAAVYRGKVRVIQRYWKARNKAQLSLFKHYIKEQLQDLMSKHFYFGLVRQEFFIRGMPDNLSWQYLKDSSLKIKKIVAAHYAKLEEIEQLKKMNVQIRQFNSKALRKHQKSLLEVPGRPCYPVFRYFRDLNILKAMVRSWFEIEYRRHVRRLKKEGKSLPKNMKML